MTVSIFSTKLSHSDPRRSWATTGFPTGTEKILVSCGRATQKGGPQGLWESDDTLLPRLRPFAWITTRFCLQWTCPPASFPPGRWVVLPSVSVCSKGADCASSHVFLLTYWTWCYDYDCFHSAVLSLVLPCDATVDTNMVVWCVLWGAFSGSHLASVPRLLSSCQERGHEMR